MRMFAKSIGATFEVSQRGYMKPWPKALQLTAAGRRGCSRSVSWPPSLSVGRWQHCTFMKKTTATTNNERKTIIWALWSVSPFKNDNALDWVWSLEGVEDTSVLSDALDCSHFG